MTSEEIILLIGNGKAKMFRTSCQADNDALVIQIAGQHYTVSSTGKNPKPSIPDFKGYIRLSAINRGP